MSDPVHEIEQTGKTLEEAVAAALTALAAERDDVEVEVLSESGRGLLGIFGQPEVRVRVTRKESVGAKATALTTQILALLDMDATVLLRTEDAESVLVQVDAGDDTGLVIGRRGETLGALQHLVALLANKGREHRKRVLIDAGGYLERREQALRSLAERSADKVRSTGRPITLEALSSRERRIIHTALADAPDIATSSIGDEPNRRVVVSPARSGSSAPLRREIPPDLPEEPEESGNR